MSWVLVRWAAVLAILQFTIGLVVAGWLRSGNASVGCGTSRPWFGLMCVGFHSH